MQGKVNRTHANYNNLRGKFYRQSFLICVYFCVYFFTQVFHACFSRGICVQDGGFPRMKHACNAAMPVACTVMLTINNTFSRRKRYRIYLRLLQWSLTSPTFPSHTSPRPILDVPKSQIKHARPSVPVPSQFYTQPLY